MAGEVKREVRLKGKLNEVMPLVHMWLAHYGFRIERESVRGAKAGLVATSPARHSLRVMIAEHRDPRNRLYRVIYKTRTCIIDVRGIKEEVLPLVTFLQSGGGLPLQPQSQYQQQTVVNFVPQSPPSSVAPPVVSVPIIGIKCPRCSAPIQVGAEFCDQCGQHLAWRNL